MTEQHDAAAASRLLRRILTTDALETRYKRLLLLQQDSPEPYSRGTVAILNRLIRNLKAQGKFAEADEFSLQRMNVIYFLTGN